jgi:uncharacterized protein DUF5681
MNKETMEADMADALGQDSVRDERGRFVPGQSGNPAGKAPGTRNRATLLRAALDAEDGPAMARVIIDKAVAGDAVTARFVIDRLEPRPRSRAIAIDLPEGAGAHDVVAAYDATVAAMMVGEITPDEAVQVTRVLDGRLRAIEAARREIARDERKREWRRDMQKRSPSGLVGKRSDAPGEGAGRRFDGDDRVAATRPHADRPERLSKGPGGEGVMALDSLVPMDPGWRSRFAGDLLHSTCIGRFAASSPGLAAGGSVV